MEQPKGEEGAYEQQRISDMLELIELATGWFDEVHHLPPETLQSVTRLSAKAQSALG